MVSKTNRSTQSSSLSVRSEIVSSLLLVLSCVLVGKKAFLVWSLKLKEHPNAAFGAHYVEFCDTGTGRSPRSLAYWQVNLVSTSSQKISSFS